MDELIPRFGWWKARRHFAKQDADTQVRLKLLRAGWSQSQFSEVSPDQFAFQVMCTAMGEVCTHDMEGFEGSDFDLSYREIIKDIIEEEGLLDLLNFTEEHLTDQSKLPKIRNYIELKEKHLADPLEALSAAMNALASIIGEIFNRLPRSAIGLLNGSEDDIGGHLFEVDAIDLITDAKNVISDVLGYFEATGCTKLGIFEDERETYVFNAYRHSKLEITRDQFGQLRYEQETSKKRLIPAFEFKGSTEECLKTYFKGGFTPKLFKFKIPFSIPQTKRFEHVQITGKTGHGKTQLLQKMILKDLLPVLNDEASLVVIDSQGDMIEKISKLKIFDPNMEGNFADKLIIVDPTDPKKPPALNLFDFSLAGINASPRDQERLLNASIELYEYMFGSLLGAELTQKQDVIFNNLARLMTVVPGATVQHLLDFLEEDDTSINQYIGKLSGVSRRFFDSQYNDQQFKETKKQILWRLFKLFSQAGFERMFVNKKNAVDLYGAINSSKIVLINTAAAHLGDQPSKIFGRFFIALLAQATARRATIHESQRLPTYVYIDEASEYFDDKVRTLVNKARKQKIALTMAHQELKQLTPDLLNTMRTTGTKITGRVTLPDAKDFAGEMACKKEQLQQVRKVDFSHAEYNAYISDVTPTAVKIRVPFGSLESQTSMDARSYYQLVELKKDEITGQSVITEQLQPLRGEEIQTSKSDEIETRSAPPSVTPVDLKKPSEISDGLFDDDDFGSPEIL